MSIQRYGGIDEYETQVIESDTGYLCKYSDYQALEAKLDLIMLEYCPSDMTERQIKEWEDNQEKFDENTR